MDILVKTDFNIPEEHHKFGTHIKVSQGGTVRQTDVMMTYEGSNAKYLLFDCILNFTLNHNEFNKNQADRVGILFDLMSEKKTWENYCHIS